MKPTEEQKLEAKLMRRYRKALKEFELIEDGDRVLIGLSGGKDSLFLVEMLGRQQAINRPKIEVHAIHIRMQNIRYESDTRYLEDFCQRFGVKLHLVTTNFDMTTDNRKSPCFLCSWNRRKQLFLKAQELGCNKIALGHHQDDILHTALMNQMFQGHFSTMPARLTMRKMPITIIRPLCIEEEADIRRYAETNGYEKQKKLCPYETDSHRSTESPLWICSVSIVASMAYAQHSELCPWSFTGVMPSLTSVRNFIGFSIVFFSVSSHAVITTAARAMMSIMAIFAFVLFLMSLYMAFSVYDVILLYSCSAQVGNRRPTDGNGQASSLLSFHELSLSLQGVPHRETGLRRYALHLLEQVCHGGAVGVGLIGTQLLLFFISVRLRIAADVSLFFYA
jgi:tRNA 2-thiocytidine biosynthesis protein TtcA